MHGPIIVPLDGTRPGERAIPLARRVARRTGAALHLVRVHQPLPAPYAAIGDARLIMRPENLRIASQEASYLHAVARRIEAAVGRGHVHTAVIEGAVGAALAAYASEQRAALIVIAPHARGAVARLLAGSVTDYLVRKAPVPVLVVNDAPDAAQASDSDPFRRILVPVAGEADARRVLHHASAIAASPETEFTILHVALPERILDSDGSALPPGVSPTSPGQTRQRTRKRLTDVPGLRARGPNADVMIRRGVSVRATIDEVAERLEPDLVALTTRGHGWLERLVREGEFSGVPWRKKYPVLAVGPGVKADGWHRGNAGPVDRREDGTPAVEFPERRHSADPYTPGMRTVNMRAPS